MRPTPAGDARPDPDVVVIGGGPVGLYAALKAVVLNHRVVVVDKGRRFSRVTQAASIANIPGLSGVSGPALLDALRRDLLGFSDLSDKDLVEMLDDTEVVAASRAGDGFRLHVRPAEGGPDRVLHAKVVVLATGVVDRKPGIRAFDDMGHATLVPWVRDGALGYCTLCEGWSVEGKRVAVIGSGKSAEGIAKDLEEHFEADVERIELDDVERIEGVEGAVDIETRDGLRRVDKAFFSLGWYRVNNEIAVALGGRVDEHGYVVTDEDGEVVGEDGKVLRGLFAVGDVRAGRWKQIVVGWGDADTAVITAYSKRLPSVEERKAQSARPLA